MMKRIKNSKAFTLMELMIVIAIMGIICAIAIPQIRSFLDRRDLNKHHELITQEQEQQATPIETKSEVNKGETRL
jgi:prepilin-type N-terminal cleavage/methylation domain-containing protein